MRERATNAWLRLYAGSTPVGCSKVFKKIVDTQRRNRAMVVNMNRQTKHESISTTRIIKRVDGWDMC